MSAMSAGTINIINIYANPVPNVLDNIDENTNTSTNVATATKQSEKKVKDFTVMYQWSRLIFGRKR